MRSAASRACDAYRKSRGDGEALARITIRSARFAPRVVMPGGESATVLLFADGSMARALPGSPKAETISSPADVAVATEALNGPNGTETARWVAAPAVSEQAHLSRNLCSRCLEYRPSISRGPDGEPRLGNCPNRCWGPESHTAAHPRTAGRLPGSRNHP